MNTTEKWPTKEFNQRKEILQNPTDKNLSLQRIGIYNAMESQVLHTDRESK